MLEREREREESVGRMEGEGAVETCSPFSR